MARTLKCPCWLALFCVVYGVVRGVRAVWGVYGVYGLYSTCCQLLYLFVDFVSRVSPVVNDGPPSDMEALWVLAQARGRDEDNLPPDAKAARDRGRSLFGEGKWQEAAEAFSEAINAAPSAHLLLTNRALCNQKLERYQNPHP